MPDRHVADVALTDGLVRPVYEQPNGQQYVHDGNGDVVYGVWLLPRDEADAPDAPVIVEGW